jgi:hypothetical protein
MMHDAGAPVQPAIHAAGNARLRVTGLRRQDVLPDVRLVPPPACFASPSVRDLPGAVLFVFLNSLYLVPVLSAGYLFFELAAIIFLK